LILINKVLAFEIEDRLWRFLICGIDHKKKPLHTRTRAEFLCQFCATSLQKQAIFGDMQQ